MDSGARADVPAVAIAHPHVVSAFERNRQSGVVMSEVTLSQPEVAIGESGARIGALAGVAAAFTFFVGTAILNVPHEATDSELVAWWSAGSHQTEALLSMTAFAIAGLSFVVSFSYLRTRLLTAGSGSRSSTTIVYGAGLLFIGTLFVAASLRGVVPAAVKSPLAEQPLPGPDLLRYLPQLSYALLGFCGLLAAATAMAFTSFIAFRTRVFGRTLAWLGLLCATAIVVANVLLIGVGAIPAMLLWTVAISVALWRDGNDRPTVHVSSSYVPQGGSP
jgi:hypothetical protein